MPEVEVIKGGEVINLPPPDLTKLNNMSLWGALNERRTCRDFDGSSVTLPFLSTILFATFGDQEVVDSTLPSNIKTYGYRRTSPSAGGLQSVEPYLWALNIDGLPKGIYHYLSCRHQLELVSNVN